MGRKDTVKAAKKPGCACGQPFPHHLADVGLTDHVCSCERSYKVKDGVFVHVGHEANPFAAGGAPAPVIPPHLPGESALTLEPFECGVCSKQESGFAFNHPHCSSARKCPPGWWVTYTGEGETVDLCSEGCVRAWFAAPGA